VLPEAVFADYFVAALKGEDELGVGGIYFGEFAFDVVVAAGHV